MTKDSHKIFKSLTRTWTSSPPIILLQVVPILASPPNSNYPGWNQMQVLRSEKALHPSDMNEGDARRSFNSSMYHCYNSIRCGRL
jgi:hypothetical protein